VFLPVVESGAALGYSLPAQSTLEYPIMDFIQANLQGICARIAAARAAAGNAVQPVCLIAVSKTQPAASVVQAAQAGQRDFGENYIQEGVDKILAVQSIQAIQAIQAAQAIRVVQSAQAAQPKQAVQPMQVQQATPPLQAFTAEPAPLIWHMIGPIQSNKTRLVAEYFDWVHTVDRLKIAQRLSEQRPAPLAPLQVLIQVNIDREPSKSGALPEDVLALAQSIKALPKLALRGLMCIAERNNLASFQKLLQLKQQLDAQGLGLDVLSMGMSDDFEQAIAHGATHIRVGSAIFGSRAKSAAGG
jgi:PLP dependent protein